MIQRYRSASIHVLLGCFVLAGWALLRSGQLAEGQSTNSAIAGQKETPPASIDELAKDMSERLPPEAIAADLDKFREILEQEWLIRTLTDADFDEAIRELGKRSAGGMSRGEFLIELQKILALGNDGHAEMTHLAGVLLIYQKEHGFADFYVEPCGGDYIAYRSGPVPVGPVNRRMRYRLQLLEEDHPYITAIDGVPIERWVETISRFVPKGPALSVRWRCCQWISYLPFWRSQLGVPQSKTVRVELTTADKSNRVTLNLESGVTPSSVHLHVPKPDWRLVDNEYGYLWVRNPAASGSRVILEAMPQLRSTKGLVIDLRSNDGGSGVETLQLMAAHLLPPQRARRVVGSMVQWSPWIERETDSSFSASDQRVSEAGRKLIADHQERFRPKWQPPTHRVMEWRHMLLARPEAEPDIYPFNVPEFPKEQFYHYSSPVVVLMDHRNFSAGELFLAGIRGLDNVTLVGSPTTAAGGTSPAVFQLEKSGLEFMIGANHSFVSLNGDFIDGKGIEPDVVVHPDVDYYLGVRDRALEKAVETLKKKAAARN
jgi:hypothetical protein